MTDQEAFQLINKLQDTQSLARVAELQLYGTFGEPIESEGRTQRENRIFDLMKEISDLWSDVELGDEVFRGENRPDVQGSSLPEV